MVSEHHQTATCGYRRPPSAGHSGTANQAKRACSSSATHCEPQPAPARGREMAAIGVISRGRLECGLCAVCHMKPPGQCAAVPWHGAVVGSARYDRQGLDHARWAVQFRRSLVSRPADQRLAASLPTTAPAHLDYGRQWPSTIPVAQHQYTGAVFLAGYPRIREIYDGYRTAYRTARTAGGATGSPGLCRAGLRGRESATGPRWSGKVLV